jgi:hydroxyacylglutathione hydrolase
MNPSKNLMPCQTIFRYGLGHGAGSACGKALGAVPSTTVGYEKIRNWALTIQRKQGRICGLSYWQTSPNRLKYFAMMKKLNKVDRPLLT